MRTLLGPLNEKSSEYCSDATITRYLAARNGHVKKAAKMLKETLKWRMQYKPEEIRWVCKSTLRFVCILEIYWFIKMLLKWDIRRRLREKLRPGRSTERIVPTSMEEQFWWWDRVGRTPSLPRDRYGSWSTAWKTQSWTYRKTKNKWFGWSIFKVSTCLIYQSKCLEKQLTCCKNITLSA